MNLVNLFRRTDCHATDQSLPKLHASKRKSTRRKSARRWDVETLEARQLLTATVEMIDVNLNGLGSYPSSFVELNGQLRFAANGQLYTTDGTEAGTVPLDADSPLSGIWSELVDVNGTLFFNGLTNRTDLQPGLYAGDNELWKTDGTLAGTLLVKDIYPGTSPTPYGTDAPNSSSPYDLTNVGGTLFFTANDGINGRELWKSDGTQEGTVLFKDIRTDVSPYGLPNGSYPGNLRDVNGTLFFVADDGIHGRELWKSDGTGAGTVLVKDLNLNTSEDGSVAFGSDPANLINVNGTLFFTANDGVGGTELWKSDGSADGTVVAKEIGPDAIGSDPAWLTNIGGNLFFTANDTIHGTELWRTDGTDVGTVMVYDISPNEVSSSPANLFNVNGTLVFAADDGTNGAELWQSDGTADGTTLIRDINPGAAGSTPNSFLNANGTLYFRADDGPAHGIELWKSDGTSDGTQLAGDFWPGPLSSAAVPLFAAGDTIYVRADVSPYGVELWKTDGTETGVELVKDIRQGNWGSAFNIDRFSPAVTLNGELYFSADTCPNCVDYELWRTDGTQAGTEIVKNINATERSRNWNLSSSPTGMTVFDEQVFFSANDVTHGNELWKTDGTENGTMLVKDIVLGGAASYPFGLVDVNGMLFFSANDSTTGSELWRSDGTEAGTVLVKDINPGSTIGAYGEFPNSSFPGYLTNVNGTLLFTANDPINGFELWRSDGTEAGTMLVKDINPGSTIDPYGAEIPNSSGIGNLFNNGDLINLNGTLYFSATDGASGVELWKSDGTEAGTMLVKDIYPGSTMGPYGDGTPNSSYVNHFVNVNGTLYFVADDGAHGRELWQSDGTAAGTVMVKDLNLNTSEDGSVAYGSDPANLINVNGTLFFTADDGSHGVELWRSTGTDAGTLLVADMNPGPASSFELASPFSFSSPNLVKVNDKVYFAADDGVHGTELWQSDGTTDGTTLLADIIPGPASGNPRGISSVGNILFFTAPADGFRELFRIDLATVVTPSGDFNSDDRYDCTDVDELVDAVFAGTHNVSFDLTGDGIVDGDDLDAWLAEAAVANGFPQSYVRGDATLDGKVDALDLNVVGLSWQRSVSGWCRGDFSADGVVNATDLNQLAINWRSNITPAAAAGPVADEALEAVLGRPSLGRTPRAPLAATTLPAIAELGHETLAPSPGQDSLSFNTSNWQPRHPFAQAISSQQLAATDAASFGMSQGAIRRYSAARLSRQAVDNARDRAIVQIVGENAAPTGSSFWGESPHPLG